CCHEVASTRAAWSACHRRRKGGPQVGIAPFVRFAVATVSLLAILAGAAQPAVAAPGDLDSTFGGDGQVTTNFAAGESIIHALAVQKDGRIVAGGTINLTDPNQACVSSRYQTGGVLDLSVG